MTNLQERARVLLLAAMAAGVGLLALAQHGLLQRERERSSSLQEKQRAAEELAARTAKELETTRAASAAIDNQLRSAQGVGSELRERLESLQKEAAARDQVTQAALGQLQAKLTELASATAELKSQAASQIGVLSTRLEEALKAREAAVQLGTQVAALEARVKEKEAQATATAGERDKLRTQLDRAQGEAAALRAAAERQAASRARESAVPEKPAPAVPVVTSVDHVDDAAGVVIVGAGAKLGLEAGHTLWVTRDGKPIGRLRVLKTHEDMAGASVLETEPGEKVQLADRVATGAGAAPTPTPEAPHEASSAADLPLGKAPPPPPRLPENFGK